MSYAYDTAFMDYAATASRHAAQAVARLLVPALRPKSVLDVGCAGGAWVAAWQSAGVPDSLGIDGDYVDRSRLLIDADRFVATDISAGFHLGRRFDLVQCLEVAEHIPPACSRPLIKSIADHAERFVLFSAAPPGQGGEYHINEQTYDYWRSLLVEQGFEAFDFVRPAIRSDRNVSFWYRYNTILYVRNGCADALSGEVTRTRIPSATKVADVSPLLFRMRKSTVRMLPAPAQHALARLKANLFPSGRL